MILWNGSLFLYQQSVTQSSNKTFLILKIIILNPKNVIMIAILVLLL